MCHWCHLVKILDVDGHELGMWSGNYAIEKCFDGEDICCWGFTVSRVIVEIAPHDNLCSVWILLLQSIVAADPAV